MAKTKKTQAIRLLEARGIDHRLTTYDVSGEFHSGEDVAALVEAAPDSVYKTLVAVRDGSTTGKAMLVMIPVAEQLDLKAIAAAVGGKKVRMATQREAERLTGLEVGGISALALTGRSFDVLIDDRAKSRERIHVSAGARGIDVELPVEELVALTGARYVKLENAHE